MAAQSYAGDALQPGGEISGDASTGAGRWRLPLIRSVSARIIACRIPARLPDYKMMRLRSLAAAVTAEGTLTERERLWNQGAGEAALGPYTRDLARRAASLQRDRRYQGSEHPEQIIIVSGHLDSWDLGTGAIDDGAGVTVSMEAANLIQNFTWCPKRTIRAIA